MLFRNESTIDYIYVKFVNKLYYTHNNTIQNTQYV